MSARTRADLDAALRAHAIEEWGGDLVIDWIIVAGLISVDTDHSIGIETSRENMPGYISNGLLHEALHIDTYRSLDEEDE